MKGKYIGDQNLGIKKEFITRTISEQLLKIKNAKTKENIFWELEEINNLKRIL